MKRTMFKKAKNSFLGRMLRRLAGEEKGAVMMEYIVVALLIAVAAIIAVGVLGSTVSGMFAVLTTGISNQGDDAVTLNGTVKTEATEGIKASAKHVKDLNAGNAGAKDSTGWEGTTSTGGGTNG